MMMPIANTIGLATSRAATNTTARKSKRSPCSCLCVTMRKMFSTITIEPSTIMPKSTAPMDSKLAGIFA